jgi:hypothetical protein
MIGMKEKNELDHQEFEGQVPTSFIAAVTPSCTTNHLKKRILVQDRGGDEILNRRYTQVFQ